MMNIVEITLVIFSWCLGGSIGIGVLHSDFNLSFFNPIRNYKEWTKMNWFGVGVSTLFFNIILLPHAIVYWIYKIFTVGRKI